MSSQSYIVSPLEGQDMAFCQPKSASVHLVSAQGIGPQQTNGGMVDKPSNAGQPAKIDVKAVKQIRQEYPLSKTKGNHFGNLSKWNSELVFIVLSLISLIAIVATLKAFDRQALPKLPLQVTLNTLLAFLVTISKATLMVCVAEAISQSKWRWFREDHPLTDYEVFDDASRGVRGSLRMLFRFRWRTYGSIGAIISVVGIVTSPITQQAISYPTRVAPVTESASVRISQNLHDRATGSRDQAVAAQAGINAGLSASWDTVFDLPPNCPTGDCDYPTIQTLGICAKTGDVSQYVSVKRMVPSLSNKWSLWNRNRDISSGGWNASLTLPGSALTTPVSFNVATIPMTDSLAFPDDRDLYLSTVFRMAVVYSNGPETPYPLPESWDRDPIFKAIEVVFYQCIKELKVSTSNGSSNTREMASWYKVIESGSTPIWNYKCFVAIPGSVFGADECQLLNPDNANATTKQTTVQSQPMGKENVTSNTFSASRSMMNQFAAGFMMTLIGSYAWDGGEEDYYSASPSTMRYIQAITLGVNDTDEETLRRTTEASENLARASTNIVRAMGSNDDTDDSTLVFGTAWRSETYVYIHWPWLALLATEVAAGTFLLALAIWSTARTEDQVTKSSALATLAALDSESREILGSIGSVKEMETHAKHMRVRFVSGRLTSLNLSRNLED